MIGVVALAIEKIGKKLMIADSRMDDVTTNGLLEALELITSSYDNKERNLVYLKVTWDLTEFINLFTTLLSEPERATLMKTSRVEIISGTDKIRLFYIPQKMLGITVKWREHKKGNIYSEHVVEENVYQLKDFFQGVVQPPKTVYEVAEYGKKILDTFADMGIQPTKLISPANVFQECVLDKMTFINIYRLPENALEMANLVAQSMNDEWREVYKIGYFDKAYDYDQTAAYPSIMANLPNLYNANYYISDKEDKTADWGIMQGTLTIHKDMSPVNLGKQYPKGEFKTSVTTEMVKFLREYKIGDFVCERGYYLKLTRTDKPFEYIMKRLFEYRGKDNIIRDKLSKAMANSLYGKFSQVNNDGNFGDHFQPIYAKMITDRAKIKVAQFIYDNELENNVIAVMVDGVLTDKFVVVPTKKVFGEWRYNGEYPALAMADGHIWYSDKKPLGFTYQEAVKPEKLKVLHQDIKTLDAWREFSGFPAKYQDWLNNIYRSKALDAGDIIKV